MLNDKNEKGQTVIETALMMILLLVLIFGIAEIARAWWLKNQLNNAARVGVRVAIVTPGLTNISATTCLPPPANPVVLAACNSITNTALHDDFNTKVGLNIIGNGGTADPSDTIIVTVQGKFVSIVPNLATLSFGLIPDQIPMSTDASMRYE